MCSEIKKLLTAWQGFLYNIEALMKKFASNRTNYKFVGCTPNEIKELINNFETQNDDTVCDFGAEWITTFDTIKQLLSDLQEFIYGSLPGELSFEERTHDTLVRLCGPDVKSDHKIGMSCILFHYTDEYPRLQTRAEEFTCRINASSAAVFAFL